MDNGGHPLGPFVMARNRQLENFLFYYQCFNYLYQPLLCSPTHYLENVPLCAVLNFIFHSAYPASHLFTCFNTPSAEFFHRTLLC